MAASSQTSALEGQATGNEGDPLVAVARLFPWMVVPVAFIIGLRPLSDPDIWWHLRTGETVLTSGLLTTDPWSFASTEDTPWVLHEWLVEVGFALGYRLLGYDGVILLRAALFAALVAVIVWQCRRRSGPLVSAVVAITAILGTLASSAERPQLVSFLILAWIGPLMLDRTRAGQAMPWLSLIIWPVWANSHGLWASALALYGALVAVFAIKSGWSSRRRWLPMVGYGLAATALISVNPAGPRLLLAPLEVRRYAQFVSEWDPPSLVGFPGLALALLLAVIAIGWARVPERVDAITICYVLVAGLLGVSYLRTVALGCILLAPVAAASVDQLLAGRVALEERAKIAAFSSQARLAGVAVLASAMALSAAVILPASPSIPQNTPWMATEALGSVTAQPRVFSEYDLGGWLLWAAPEVSPAIDGRTEIYDVDYVDQYLKALRMRGDWRGFVESLDVDAVWLRQDTPLVEGLEEIAGWDRVYEDSWSVILVPPPSS